MRSGCSEYLTKPLNVDQVVESLARLSTGRFRRPARSRLPNLWAACWPFWERAAARAPPPWRSIWALPGAPYGKKTHPGSASAASDMSPCIWAKTSANYHFYEVVRNIARLDQALLEGFVIHHAVASTFCPRPMSSTIRPMFPSTTFSAPSASWARTTSTSSSTARTASTTSAWPPSTAATSST